MVANVLNNDGVFLRNAFKQSIIWIFWWIKLYINLTKNNLELTNSFGLPLFENFSLSIKIPNTFIDKEYKNI